MEIADNDKPYTDAVWSFLRECTVRHGGTESCARLFRAFQDYYEQQGVNSPVPSASFNRLVVAAGHKQRTFRNPERPGVDFLRFDKLKLRS